MKALTVVVILLCLTGCHWFKQGALPQVSSLKQFPSQTQSYQPVDNLPYVQWWQQFHDKTLNQYMAQGLKVNLDLAVAKSHLEQSRGELRRVKLNWLPSLLLLGGYSTNPAFGNVGGFYGIWPTYAMNILSQIQQQKYATYQVETLKAMVDGVRLAVIGQIANAYFTLLAEEEQLVLLERLASDYQQLVTLTTQSVHIGLKNKIDISFFSVKHKLVKAEIEVVRQNILAANNALRYLLNLNPGHVKNSQAFARLNFSQFKPGSLPVTVLKNRPDLRMAEYALQASHTGVALAYSQFFPALQLDQFLGEGTQPITQFDELTDAYMTATLAPSTLGAADAAKGQYHANVYAYIRTLRRILKEVDTDFSENRRFNGRFMETQRAFADYTYKFHLQSGLLDAGLMSYQALLESRLKLDSIALMRNVAKLQLALSLVKLYQDLAGGYQC